MTWHTIEHLLNNSCDIYWSTSVESCITGFRLKYCFSAILEMGAWTQMRETQGRLDVWWHRRKDVFLEIKQALMPLFNSWTVYKRVKDKARLSECWACNNHSKKTPVWTERCRGPVRIATLLNLSFLCNYWCWRRNLPVRRMTKGQLKIQELVEIVVFDGRLIGSAARRKFLFQTHRPLPWNYVLARPIALSVSSSKMAP